MDKTIELLKETETILEDAMANIKYYLSIANDGITDEQAVLTWIQRHMHDFSIKVQLQSADFDMRRAIMVGTGEWKNN